MTINLTAVWINPDGQPETYSCGCRALPHENHPRNPCYEFRFCPLHRVADDLLDKTQKLAIVAEALEGGESPGIFDWLKIRDEARATIAKTKETPHEVT